MDNKSYDIIIVGAGPTGLAIAHCCSHLKGKKILIIDREKTIGGCHRVIRKDGYFTEHGPRVYFINNYNLFYLMSEFGVDMEDIYTYYKFSTISTILNILPVMSITEVFKLTELYLYYLLDINYGTDINFEKYIKDNGFSSKTIDLFDRIFRFLDGAPLHKYSVNKIQEVVDSALLSSVLQPKKPLDETLFNKWQSFLEKRGVDFLLDTNIEKIHYDNDKITSVNGIKTDKLILAVPPNNLSKILEKNDDVVKNCFGDFNSLREWSNKTGYIDYISITYHFFDNIDIPIISGTTFNTDWGIISINLSDYMTNIENKYKKLLSVAITYTDKKSIFINKTANECNEEELYDEVHRQLKASIYPDLPDKKHYDAFINPNNYYKEGRWSCKDDAYFNTIGTKYLKNTSDTISNIYNAGTHNGNSFIKYTLIESAISNGMTLSTMIYPELREKYRLKTFLTMRDYIYYLLYFIIVMIIIYLIFYIIKHI